MASPPLEFPPLPGWMLREHARRPHAGGPSVDWRAIVDRGAIMYKGARDASLIAVMGALRTVYHDHGPRDWLDILCALNVQQCEPRLRHRAVRKVWQSGLTFAPRIEAEDAGECRVGCDGPLRFA